MITKTLQICNKLGLHARAASEFVKTAGAFGASITIKNPNKEANGKSIMSVMMLEAAFGSTIEVVVDGEDEVEAMEAIEALVANRFGEAE